MRSRKLLAFILCLITGPALAGYMTLLGAGLGAVQPVAQATFTNSSYSTNLSNLTSIATFSRAGNAMQFDSSGYLTYGPNNLLTYSNTFSNAAWTKSTMNVASGATDPFGTTLAWTLTATGPGALLYQLQSPAGPNAIPYVWMRRKTGTGIIYLRNANNVSVDVTAQVSSTWAFVYVAPTAALGSNLFLISLATSGDEIEIYSAGYSAVTYETAPRANDKISTGASAYYGPRFDYTYNGSSWVPAGLLVEGAATNLIKDSNNFSSANWSNPGSGGTITATGNSGTSPDGTNNLWLITYSGNPGQAIYQALSSIGTYTTSIVVKRGNADWVFLELYNSTDRDKAVWFNLATGAKGTQSAGATGTITSLGGGFYRITVSAAMTAVNTLSVLPIPVTGDNTFARVAAGTVYVYGAQGEAGASDTSYTPTGASAVTRAAETVQLTGAALTAFGGVAGSSIVEHTALSTYQSGTSRIIGTTTGRAPIFIAANNQVGTYNGTNLLYATPGSGGLFSTTVRTGAAWSAAGRSIVANGGTVGTDANSMFGGVAPVTANLGSDVGSSNWGSGWYKSFAIYNSRLPDATLQQKSVVGAPY